MGYPNAHLVLRWGGHFGTSADERDEWSTGLKLGLLGSDVPYDEGKLSSLVTATSAALTSFHGSPTSGVGGACFLDWVTGARHGAGLGKYDPETQDTVRLDRTPFAGGGSSDMPWSTAHVTSLRTTRPRGYASNGRLYYPCLTFTVQADTGRINATQLNNRISNMKTLLDAINTAAKAYDATLAIQVISAVQPTGVAATVTHIRADYRLDSIERRENQQPAVYETRQLA